MKHITNIFTTLIAIASIGVGIGLLIHAGLPHRADFTGTLIGDIGYVAPEINNTAPPFSLSTLESEQISLYNLKGQPVIINFWATWCVPCRTEMIELQTLYTDYQNDIRILGVNLGESPQAVAQWVEELGLTYDILLDPLQTMTQLYQIRGQPSTYVLDTDMTIHALYYGAVQMEQLENDIRTILNRR